jgi:hypothetical protein
MTATGNAGIFCVGFGGMGLLLNTIMRRQGVSTNGFVIALDVVLLIAGLALLFRDRQLSRKGK